MPNLTRRNSLLLFAAPAAAVAAGTDLPATAPAPPQHWKQIPPRELIRQRYFPDVRLTTHENKKVRLYEDLVRDKILIMNFMFTSCGRICPRVVDNLVKVQRLLGERAGRDVLFCSFTLDASRDTPEKLRQYAAVHHVGPGWQFLTGPVDRMEMLRRRLGFTDPDPETDKDRESHIGNIRYGNEAESLWGACPGMSNPQYIVESLSWVSRPGASPA